MTPAPIATVLHHVSLPASDLRESKAMYDAALGALGYRRVYEGETNVCYGVHDDEDMLCLKQRDSFTAAGDGFHLAFTAPSREAVDAFHAAALVHGATDNGSPGPRPRYGPNYYAAFIIDPDGHYLEAVHK